MLTLHTDYELLCLCDIVLLTCGQREPQGIAKTIHTHMDLRGEPASASTKRLRLLTTVFGVRPPRKSGPGLLCCL